MNSILRQINQNNGQKSNKELMETYLNLVDEELNKLYSKTDCVQNYGQYFQKCKENSRQIYHCVHNSCDFSTNKSSFIVRHIRRHLKQKPYLCPIDGCKQRFYQRCDLRCHLMRHIVDKPFKCDRPECQKTYTTRKALSLHIKTHSAFAFDCNICEKTFATKWKLNKHIKERHTLSESFLSQNLVQNSIQLKAEPLVNSKVKPKVESEANSLDRPNIKSMTNRLIYSINGINEQMREELLSKQSINKFSADFGFEEVIEYVVENCGKPSNNQTVTNSAIETLTDNISDLSDSIIPMDLSLKTERNESNLMANQMLVECQQNVCSLIETYSSESNDSNKKFLFKCINCIFTSNTIKPIVRHVLGHISQGVTTYLRNKYIGN